MRVTSRGIMFGSNFLPYASLQDLQLGRTAFERAQQQRLIESQKGFTQKKTHTKNDRGQRKIGF